MLIKHLCVNFYHKIDTGFQKILTRSKKNQKGLALMMAMSSLAMIMYFATQLMSDTTLEYNIHANSIHKIKAYYAAKSGLDIALLRIKIYQTVLTKLPEEFKKNPSQMQALDMIWSFPWAWPLPAEALNAVDKELFASKAKESLMDAQYMVTIEDEGGKIDINDLGSPSKSMRESTARQILGIFESKKQHDEEWAKAHENTNFQEIVNNMIDWVSVESTGVAGGDKKSLYADRKEKDSYPPSRNFRSVDEVRLVAGMTEDFFQLLKPRITVFGMKGINPNMASKELIMAIHPSISPQAADEVVARRQSTEKGGPFRDAQDFYSFLAQQGAKITSEEEKQIPLVFSSVMNFQIRSIGSFAKSTREISVITYQLGSSAGKIAESMQKENPQPAPAQAGLGGAPPPADRTSAAKNNETLPKGRPKIVYWQER